MPNWCNNNLRLEHNDPAMIERFIEGFKAGKAMGAFLPCPEELVNDSAPFRGEGSKHEELMEKYGAADWYDWAVKNWGTKWDIGGDDDLIERTDDNTVNCTFDSAWAPPIEFYRYMASIGFIVEAMYDECGMAFCGSVTTCDGEIWDDYYEYGDMSSDEIQDTLPPELDEAFCISEQKADWEAEQENEEGDE